MDGLAKKVAVELQQIFPDRKAEDLLGVVTDSSLHYGIITEELLLQRAIEHILDSSAGVKNTDGASESDMQIDSTTSHSLTGPVDKGKKLVKLKDRCYGPYFGGSSPVFVSSSSSSSRSASPDREDKKNDSGVDTDSNFAACLLDVDTPPPLPPKKNKKSTANQTATLSASQGECVMDVDKRIPNFDLIEGTLDVLGDERNQLEELSKLMEDVNKVLSFFPDADPNWVERTIQEAKWNSPSSYLDIVISSMFDASYVTIADGQMSSSSATIASEGKNVQRSAPETCSKRQDAETDKTNATQKAEAGVTPLTGSKRDSRKRMCSESDDGGASPTKQEKQDSVVMVSDDDDHLDLSGPASPSLLTSGFSTVTVSINTDGDVAAAAAYGFDEENPDVPKLPEELLHEVPNVALLPCDKCASPQELMELAQCSDGHVLCRICMEQAAKNVLSNAEKEELQCPVSGCELTVPLSESERVLHYVLADLLRARSEQASLKKIAAMKGMVQCQNCECVLEMMPGDKQFSCGNSDCLLSFCRYCKRNWDGYDHTNCCPLSCKMENGTPSNTASLPSNWVPFPENFTEDFLKVPLDMSSEESQYVTYQFQQSMGTHASILAVFRIQNVRLWQKFALARQHMVEDFGEEKLNEKLLFHGTHAKHMDSICKEGFDWRLCGVNGTSYGQGCYFASAASYSHRYCFPSGSASSQWLQACSQPDLNARAKQNWKNVRLMFAARVLCGRTIHGSPNLRRPPTDTSDPKLRPYNSTCDNPQNPGIFVVYDSAQTYPEYVVAYL